LISTFNVRSSGPVPIAVDASGSFYYSQIFAVAKGAAYNAPTVAGNGQSPQVGASVGDGGLATAAPVYVSGLVFDASGNLLIADQITGRIRRVNSAGIISTIAGAGKGRAYADTGDGGAALAAGIAPLNMALDAAGNLYFSDSSYIGQPSSSSIRKMTPAGLVNTVFTSPFLSVSYPGLAVDSGGRL
jgi:sugar lactone lactonase YvrE